MDQRPLLAIFVGGKSSRMGTHKGLLVAPGRSETIVESLVRLGREAGLDPALIGDARPYLGLVPEIARIDDDPPNGGPLAGLRAAARHALGAGRSHLVAVACDMPYVTVEALRQASEHPSSAAVLAPRRGRDAPWEPMLARYEAARIVDVLDETIVARARSFQKLFETIEVDPLPLSPAVARALRDWDTPGDIEP
ncbi:MAG TPA: NTP transferase domain-containing protein [Polyangiales bacterium]|nr:NTP transferase domain-containing protein [Polyangiales bacterium]